MVSTLTLFVLLSSTPERSYPVFEEKGQLYLRAGKPDGIQLGSDLKLLGKRPGKSEARAEVGKARVVEVLEDRARLQQLGDARPARPEVAQVMASAGTPAAAKPPKAEAAPAAAKVDEFKISSGGFNDHLRGTCAGTTVEIFRSSGFTGSNFRMEVDGQQVAEDSFRAGSAGSLRASVKGNRYSVAVQEGAWGTDYLLHVNDQPCKLEDL